MMWRTVGLCRCCKELNQWDLLLDFANNKGNSEALLVLESAWRVPNWALMKDALSQVWSATAMGKASFEQSHLFLVS